MKTFFLLVLLAVLAVGGYAAWYVRSPVAMSAESVEVEVPPGTRLRGTIALLQRSGVQVKPSHFEALARLLGRERDIKAGNYLLTQPITPIDLLDKLTRGDVTQAEIRLIEGWTFAQFRAALDANPDLKHDTTGVEDADSRAHSPNESLHLGVLRKAILSEALFLAAFDRGPDRGASGGDAA